LSGVAAKWLHLLPPCLFDTGAGAARATQRTCRYVHLPGLDLTNPERYHGQSLSFSASSDRCPAIEANLTKSDLTAAVRPLSGLARKFAHVPGGHARSSREQVQGQHRRGRLRVVHSTHAVGAAAGSCSRRRSRCRAPGMRADEGRPRGVGTCSPPTRSLWRDSTSRLGAPVGVNSPTL
jgi:hypothetical protein